MFWGLATITASETGFKEVEGKPSWTSLARAVFNMMADRWDGECGGGSRWQIWQIKNGFNLKNSISNGGFFALAARLGLFTKNETYADWANKIWDWSQDSPLVNNHTWYVCDSTNTADGCKGGDRTQWSYNYGSYILGAAFMYKHVCLSIPRTPPIYHLQSCRV